jgi:photosynthetic reaction center cytochrome c subunit
VGDIVKRSIAVVFSIAALSTAVMAQAPAGQTQQPPKPAQEQPKAADQQKPDQQKPDQQKPDQPKTQEQAKPQDQKPAPQQGQQPAAPPATPQPPPPPPHNLQVLPKDMSRQDVVVRMQAISQALGVQCGYCHVEDRASDEKPVKNTARVMMRLTGDINQKLGSEIGKPANEVTRVGCVTCHRGVAIPKQLSEIILDTEAQKGTKAAIDQYWDLRRRYFGRQAYDFGEMSLVDVAQKLAQDKPDDALQFCETNTTFFPNSGRTYFVMAQAYNAKKDKAKAIENLERAVVLDPQNAQAKRMLEQLRSGTSQ